MPVIALITWIVTALGGLYLLAIWLIEYDPDFQRAAATRLPVPVISGHVLLALGGLAAWIIYLLTDMATFAFATVGILAFVATLGLTMAVRWVGVYRATPTRPPVAVFTGPASAAGGPRDAWTPGQAQAVSRTSAPGLDWRPGELAVPPERHFPLTVVIAHGIFAIVTIVLVLLTVLGVGSS
jgi:hypothetical protein